MKIQSILTVCIVSFGSTFVRSLKETADQTVTYEVNGRNEIRNNVQNLLISIAKNDKKNSDIYRKFLTLEAEKERQTFDAMKKELRNAQNKNTYKKRHFFEANIGENVAANKREIKETEFTKEPYIFPEIHDGNALQPTLDLVLSQKQYCEEMKRIYQRMLQTNDKGQFLPLIDVMIINSNRMLKLDIQTIQGYLATGAPNDQARKQPWLMISSNSIENTWKTMIEWNEKMRGDRGLDADIDAMIKVARSALHELEIYQKYAQKMYDIMVTTPYEPSSEMEGDLVESNEETIYI